MSSFHAERAVAEWERLLAILKKKSRVNVQGDSLSIASLVAVSRFRASAYIDNLPAGTIISVNKSVRFLEEALEQGHSVYGVNTGFGGSADTSTSSLDALQTALLQMQLSAILPVTDSDNSITGFIHQSNTTTAEAFAKLAMPESWVRGAILIRCNSLIRGHSAVRLELIQSLVKLLEHDLVPLVPLRGSISASGDLCPLAYVAGTLEGNPDVFVWSGPPNNRTIISADKALEATGLTPISYRPKETLGLLNGTAFSVSAATLCHYEADNLASLAQVLTAMGVEALLGSIESFDPFIAAVRPHKGQIEVANNVRKFLTGSKLASLGHEHVMPDGELRQDRYALRTSSQWLSPVLEDLYLARDQLEVDLNSTTDNPLFDAANKHIYHGGNFQGSSIASSTEKTRMSLEKIGKLIFAQSSELLDVRLAHNLPPNLAADEPSLSYTMKGVDINMASYYSELAWVASPVSNHVQSAEMSNQALNSLALISTRATHTAVDLVSMMSAAYLYSLCQALDLRAMNEHFVSKLEPAVRNLGLAFLSPRVGEKKFAILHSKIWIEVSKSLAATTTKDSSDRFIIVARSAQYLVVQSFRTDAISDSSSDELSHISDWTERLAITCKDVFLDNRLKYLAQPDASSFLGNASKKMYRFVRKDLGVPMHKGLIDHPTFGGVSAPEEVERVTTGTQISRIYKALREERMTGVIMECLGDAVAACEKERRGLYSKL